MDPLPASDRGRARARSPTARSARCARCRPTSAWPREYDPTDRLFALELGGGALLDLGVYVVSFAQMLLGTPDARRARPARCFPTGVDAEAAPAARLRRRPVRDAHDLAAQRAARAGPGLRDRRAGSTSSPGSTTRRRSSCTATAPSPRRSPATPIGARLRARADRGQRVPARRPDRERRDAALGHPRRAAAAGGGRRPARRPARRGPRRRLVRGLLPGGAGGLIGGGHTGRRPSCPADGVGEVDGVDDRRSPGVVVEVGEDVLLGRPDVGQPVGPELQRLRAVAPVSRSRGGSAGSPSRRCATAARPAARRGRPSTARRRSARAARGSRRSTRSRAAARPRPACRRGTAPGTRASRSASAFSVGGSCSRIGSSSMPEPGRPLHQPGDRLLRAPAAA